MPLKNKKIKMSQIKKSVIFGLLAMALLLSFYFAVLYLVSGWDFARVQFKDNWYWIISLSAGFGIQIGIFTYLRAAHRAAASGKVVAASGATSTVAMISCCAHYLVNVLPIIGVSGLAAIIGQYQTEIFWLGLISNVLGIAYMGQKLVKLKSNQRNEKY